MSLHVYYSYGDLSYVKISDLIKKETSYRILICSIIYHNLLDKWLVYETNLSDGHDDAAEGGQVLGVGQRRVSGPGDVDGVAQAGARAALRRGAGAREEVAVVVPVQADVQHVRVLVEDLLRAVAVVHVLECDTVLMAVLNEDVTRLNVVTKCRTSIV